MVGTKNRVWIAQCLCPQRHAILAVADVAATAAEANKIVTALHKQVEGMLNGALNPWCGLCGARNDTWHIEVGRTQWRTLEEALPHIRAEEIKQSATRAAWGDTHRTDKPN